MSITHHTYCEFQIGDSLIHLHYLRKLAERYPNRHFVHGVKPVHISQMTEMVEDMPQIRLIGYPERDPSSTLIWKNAEGFWERHPLRHDYANFHLDWFRHLSRKLEVESPFQSAADLLFDYPALQRWDYPWLKKADAPLGNPFDVLFINSAPCSAQFRAYLNGPEGPGNFNPQYFDPLIEELAARYRVVVTAQTKVPGVPCTLDYGLTLTGIGHLSLLCPYLVMVSTGPSWPTFNVFNQQTVKERVVFLDTETLNLCANTTEVNSLERGREVLKAKGIL